MGITQIKPKNNFLCRGALYFLVITFLFLGGCSMVKEVKTNPENSKNKIFLMGIGMLRLNWTKVKGDEIRFRYSDLGLPANFSTRERASFTLSGSLDNNYKVDGYLNYDPENRITEPPLDFLFTIENKKTYLSAGDYRMGVFLDSIFSRYYHPFRGAIVGMNTRKFGVEILGGMARGESGIEELPADLGAGPYYLAESPILRGSEVVFLVVKSAANLDVEIRRQPLIRNRDYFIDYDRGEIIFNYPIYPFDGLGNPVFILVRYQYESLVGRFTRDVFGFRTFVSPVSPLKLGLFYIADADGTIPLKDAIKQRRGIYTLSMNYDSKALKIIGEYSLSQEPYQKRQNGFFGSGVLNISSKIHFYVNSWAVDTGFPTFANEQLRFGYSLYQIFPEYSKRYIFLSPFQFSRNLAGELYPFSMSRVSISEREVNSFLEWENKNTRISTGYGYRIGIEDSFKSHIGYLSAFHDGEKTKYWGKFEMDRDFDESKEIKDSRTEQALIGLRQKVLSTRKGELYFQADYKGELFDNFLSLTPSTFHHSASFLTEFLSENEGVFAGYRKEILVSRRDNREILDQDVYETGITKHIFKGFFLDSRLREERTIQNDIYSNVRLISLGGGIESKGLRLMGRYEVQINKNDSQKQRRKLWSFFVFGTPVKGMNVSLRYYKRKGVDGTIVPFSESSEEELSFRMLWRPWRFLSLYSQWRYDTNIELYPPLDRTKSNTLASIQGLKLNFTDKFELLSNYKLLKVLGPIENKKESLSAELGYLIFKHFRTGIGVEKIDFEDKFEPTGNYHSTVGYFKLMALF